MKNYKGSTGTSTNILKMTEKQKRDRKKYFEKLKSNRPKYPKPVWDYIP